MINAKRHTHFWIPYFLLKTNAPAPKSLVLTKMHLIIYKSDHADKYSWARGLNRGSYMSAHALLNLLYKLGKRDKMHARLVERFISFSQQV